MKTRLVLPSLILFLCTGGLAFADHDDENQQQKNGGFDVIPFVYDPFHTNLVMSKWLPHIGCPFVFAYQDPACKALPEPTDPDIQGLLLSKQGPTTTANPAIAGAYIKGLPNNIVLKELGYDIRKPCCTTAHLVSDYGSHCSTTSPRFKITTANSTYFAACKSALPIQFYNGWTRLRFAVPATVGPVMSLSIIFDDGTDIGPDYFGLAILDNIDVNGILVGRGPSSGEEDEGTDKDK